MFSETTERLLSRMSVNNFGRVEEAMRNFPVPDWLTNSNVRGLSCLAANRHFQAAVEWQSHRREAVGRIIQELEIICIECSMLPRVIAHNDGTIREMRCDEF